MCATPIIIPSTMRPKPAGLDEIELGVFVGALMVGAADGHFGTRDSAPGAGKHWLSP